MLSKASILNGEKVIERGCVGSADCIGHLPSSLEQMRKLRAERGILANANV